MSFALEPDQKKLARNDQYLDAKGCNFTGQVDSNINAPNSEIYSSGLSGPYILEQWAIHTLKAIAKKQNIDESKTVTKEHVIALVAFALGEGGDIMNQDLYNPLNTGINASELIEGSHSVSGVQAFKSFDAGVEATARTMVGSNQNRLAKTLSNPDSSAKDFMKALTYYQKFSGNKLWAEASMPPRQDSYFNERLDLVKQVRKDYSNIASYVIGTRTLEQADGKREKSKLVYDGGSNLSAIDDTGGDTQDCSCTPKSGVKNSEILAGDNNQEKSFRYLTQKGATPVEAAGIVGNLMVESSPDINPLASNGSHKGIAQWATTDRWPALVEYADKQGKSPRSLLLQLSFAWQEDDMKKFLKTNSKTVDEAAENFERIFERSGGSAMEKRKEHANDTYKKYGTTLPSDQPTGGNKPECESAATGEAFILDDYAWPVDLDKSEVSAGYSLPCKTKSCHHDGSAAFDLAHKDTVSKDKDKASTGKSVFAITDGEIVKNSIYNGIGGCYALQFKGKDGFVYWYGHVRNPVSKSAGKKLRAGEKIAEIGERKCTGNGSYPHLHIDRGSPKGSFGGMIDHRDTGMNSVINKLYESLP